MTAAIDKGPVASLLSTIWSARHDPAASVFNVDLLPVLVAVLLPWTTSGVSIVGVLWIVALCYIVDVRDFLASLKQPASALALAFVALVLVGVLWSDVSWQDRMHQLSEIGKLLMLPLLIYHFGRSQRGMWVFIGFLASCALLALVSCIVALMASSDTIDPSKGIFVRNYIDQGQE